MLAHRSSDGCSCIEEWCDSVVVAMFVFVPVVVMFVFVLVIVPGLLVFETVARQHHQKLQLCTASSLQ